MRIRTDKITRADLYAQLPKPELYLTAHERGSRTHARAFDVALEWLGPKERGDGRYRRNPGKSGGFDMPWAATYDEWGEWLARLFEIDPGATMTYYRDREDFHAQTNGKYLEAARAER